MATGLPAVASPAARSRELLLAGACILLAPILIIIGLRLPLINQLDYADAWFYSGYAWTPKHHFAVFPETYFGVRFPAVLSISAFDKVLGAHAGYVLLRYLLVVGVGLTFYAAVRRTVTAWTAGAALVLLMLDPFFSRLVLWDYSLFVTVTAGLAGVSLWYWACDRRLRWSILAGALVAAAIFANALFATALLVFGAVELVAHLRHGRLATIALLKRAGAALAGGLVVFLAGWLGYLVILGSFGPDDLVRPTIDFIRDYEKNAEPYRVDSSVWIGHEVRLWGPVLLALLIVAILRRRLLANDLRARMAQTFLVYLLFLWCYRFAVGGNSVLETWWNYNMLVVFAAPATAVLLQTIAEDWQRPTRHVALAAVAATALIAVVIRWAPGISRPLYDDVTTETGVMLAVIIAGVLLTLALTLSPRAVRGPALLAVVAIMTFMHYAPSVLDGRGTTGVFVTQGERDWNAYADAKRFTELVRDHDGPGRRTYLWYGETLGPASLAWAELPHLGYTVQQVGQPDDFTDVDPLGLARLHAPDAAYVLVMSTRPADLAQALTALRSAGFGIRIEREGAWVDHALRYVLAAIVKKP